MMQYLGTLAPRPTSEWAFLCMRLVLIAAGRNANDKQTFWMYDPFWVIWIHLKPITFAPSIPVDSLPRILWRHI